MTITEFCAARLDETEAAAKLAAREGGTWAQDDPERHPGSISSLGGQVVYDEGAPDEHQARHIALHDPARVLRDVAAKRAILAEHAPGYPTTYPKPSGQPTCGVCHAGGYDWDPEQWPCATVRHLAAVDSDHPDYDESWRP